MSTTVTTEWFQRKAQDQKEKACASAMNLVFANRMIQSWQEQLQICLDSGTQLQEQAATVRQQRLEKARVHMDTVKQENETRLAEAQAALQRAEKEAARREHEAAEALTPGWD